VERAVRGVRSAGVWNDCRAPHTFAIADTLGWMPAIAAAAPENWGGRDLQWHSRTFVRKFCDHRGTTGIPRARECTRPIREKAPLKRVSGGMAAGTH